jgi:hypothetical protein
MELTINTPFLALAAVRKERTASLSHSSIASGGLHSEWDELFY